MFFHEWVLLVETAVYYECPKATFHVLNLIFPSSRFLSCQVTKDDLRHLLL